MLGLDADAGVGERDRDEAPALRLATNPQLSAGRKRRTRSHGEVQERLEQDRRISVDVGNVNRLDKERDASARGFGADDRRNFLEERGELHRLELQILLPAELQEPL